MVELKMGLISFMEMLESGKIKVHFREMSTNMVRVAHGLEHPESETSTVHSR